ncbi:MAG: hypothetical protein V4443_05660 [Pseudomonadota bacterium]
MKKIHHEFAFQVQELRAQIEGILGDPPDRKNYDRVVAALLQEYTKSMVVEDVNLLSFTLVDHIKFNNPAGLLAASKQYDEGDPAAVFALATCDGTAAAQVYAAVVQNHPELARKAIITAFLYKNPQLWIDEDRSLSALGEEEDEMDEDEHAPSSEFVAMFDPAGDENAQ